MLNYKNFFKSLSALGLVQITNYILPLFVLPIITRILGPEKLGLISYLTSFITYFTLLINFGFDITASRKLIKDPNNIQLRNKIFSEVICAKLFLLIISIVIFLFILFKIPILNQNKLLAFYSFLVCFSSVFTNNWIFQVMQDLPKVALFDFLSKSIINILLISIIKVEEDYFWYILLSSLVTILIGFSNFITAIFKYKIKLHYIPIKNVLNLLINEKIYFFSLIIISLYTTTNTIILGTLTDTISIGYYIYGQKLIFVSYGLINMPLGSALFPLIGSAFAINKQKGINFIQKIIPIVFYITFIFGFILLIFGPSFLLWFYGEKFRPSLLVFRLLTFIPMIIALANLCGYQILLNLKMDKLYFKITIFSAIFSMLANYFFVRKIGYVGSAIVWILTEILILLIYLVYLRKIDIYPIKLVYFLPQSIYNQIKSIFKNNL